MLNIQTRDDATAFLNDTLAAYRNYLAMALSCFGDVREAWQRKVRAQRAIARQTIFLIRENDFEGAWA